MFEDKYVNYESTNDVYNKLSLICLNNESYMDDMILFDELDRKIKIYNQRNLLYLSELLENNGPEYAYIIEFSATWNDNRKYEIGACVRGRPMIRIKWR